MKKILLLLAAFSMSISSFAWQNMDEKLEKLNEKIQQEEVVVADDIPQYFWWELTSAPETLCPPCTNIFYRAFNKHQDNPQSYVAAFNYAMLIAYKNQPHSGSAVSITDEQEGKRNFDEAYKRFEMAKKLNPKFAPVYVEQELLIDRYLFSHIYYSPAFYSLASRLHGYTHRKDLARKRLSLIEKQISLGVENVNYLEAAVLARFFGLSEKEALYTEKAGGKQALQQEVDNAIMDLISTLWFNTEAAVKFGRISPVLEHTKTKLGFLNTYYDGYVKRSADYSELLEVMGKASAKEAYFFHEMVKDAHTYNNLP